MFRRRSTVAWILSTCLVGPGCRIAYSRPVQPQPVEECADFTGDYQYLGLARIAEVCPVRKVWPDLQLPGPGGFYIVADLPHTIRIRQERCETLRIAFRAGSSSLGDPPEGYPREIEISLERRRRADTVTWSPDALFWQRRFKPEGALLFPGPTISSMEMRLKLEAGGLRYSLKHLENHLLRKELGGEIECLLPRVAPAEP